MIFLNVSFGIYAIMPQGWIFMIFIIILECLIMTETLEKTLSNRKIYNTIIASNLISGATGFIISMVLNGGWWLVIWLPWVSDNEVRTNTEFEEILIYYFFAFILTILIETAFNIAMLYKKYRTLRVIWATLITNVISYLTGSLILYSYSFG